MRGGGSTGIDDDEEDEQKPLAHGFAQVKHIRVFKSSCERSRAEDQ